MSTAFQMFQISYTIQWGNISSVNCTVFTRVAQFQEILPKPCSLCCLGLYFTRIVTSIFFRMFGMFFDLPHGLRNISWQLYGTICAFQKTPQKTTRTNSNLPNSFHGSCCPKRNWFRWFSGVFSKMHLQSHRAAMIYFGARGGGLKKFKNSEKKLR